jgi:hypothetical protein
MKENFDFTKPEDRKQFDTLPKVPKDLIIEHAHEEAIKEEGEKSEKAFSDKIRQELHFSPEHEIQIREVKIGGKTKKEFMEEIGFKSQVSEASFSLAGVLLSPNFDIEKERFPKQTNIKLVRLSVTELGLPNNSYTSDVYKKAKELGLDLCPHEVGPRYLRSEEEQKKDDDQNENEEISSSGNVFAMNPIYGVRGDKTGLYDSTREPAIFTDIPRIKDNSTFNSHGLNIAPYDYQWKDIDHFIFYVPELNRNL